MVHGFQIYLLYILYRYCHNLCLLLLVCQLRMLRDWHSLASTVQIDDLV